MTDKFGLARTLDQLVKRASARPGEPQRQPLARGLRVDVMVKDGRTFLQISRDNQWPSLQEWNIVRRYFPQPVPNVIYSRICDKGRYYFKAQWATIVAEQGELLAPGG
jgi:hypothetical protein